MLDISSDQDYLYVQINFQNLDNDFGFYDIYAGPFAIHGMYILSGGLITAPPANQSGPGASQSVSDAGILFSLSREFLPVFSVTMYVNHQCSTYWFSEVFSYAFPSLNQAPEISDLSASPDVLWPPNGKPVPVTLDFNAFDPDGDELVVTYSVVDEYGIENVSEQELPASGTITLVASRRGNDRDGRTYTITVTVTDPSADSASDTTTVTVLHDRGKRKK
jgi:hypothetical protein